MLSCSPTPSPLPTPHKLPRAFSSPKPAAQKEGLGELTEYGAVPYRASHVSSACARGGWGDGNEASIGAAQESSPSGRVARREGSKPASPSRLPPASLPLPPRWGAARAFRIFELSLQTELNHLIELIN